MGNDKHDNSIVNQDNLQCKFNPRNFKILYVINSENCFYRKLALTRAKLSHKAVSRRKQADFGRWHSKWLKANVSDSSQTSINEWFMGKCDGLVPNKTHKILKTHPIGLFTSTRLKFSRLHQMDLLWRLPPPA